MEGNSADLSSDDQVGTLSHACDGAMSRRSYPGIDHTSYLKDRCYLNSIKSTSKHDHLLLDRSFFLPPSLGQVAKL